MVKRRSHKDRLYGKGRHVSHKRINAARARRGRLGQAYHNNSDEGDISSLETSSVSDNVRSLDDSDVDISSDTLQPQAASTPLRPRPRDLTLRNLRVQHDEPPEEPLPQPLNESSASDFSGFNSSDAGNVFTGFMAQTQRRQNQVIDRIMEK